MEKKQDIRKRILALRSELSEVQWIEKSKAVYEQLISLKEMQEAQVLYLYMDFRNEVRTKELIAYGWNQGKTVAVPKIEDGEMIFYSICAFEDVQKGYFGVMEPVTKVQEERPGFMVMPGVAFDQSRNRLGYGKGFYDRFLSSHAGITAAAAAFELQVVDQIQADPHDIKPKYLVTEKRMI